MNRCGNVRASKTTVSNRVSDTTNSKNELKQFSKCNWFLSTNTAVIQLQFRTIHWPLAGGQITGLSAGQKVHPVCGVERSSEVEWRAGLRFFSYPMLDHDSEVFLSPPHQRLVLQQWLSRLFKQKQQSGQSSGHSNLGKTCQSTETKVSFNCKKWIREYEIMTSISFNSVLIWDKKFHS